MSVQLGWGQRCVFLTHPHLSEAALAQLDLQPQGLPGDLPRILGQALGLRLGCRTHGSESVTEAISMFWRRRQGMGLRWGSYSKLASLYCVYGPVHHVHISSGVRLTPSCRPLFPRGLGHKSNLLKSLIDWFSYLSHLRVSEPVWDRCESLP